MLGGWRPIGESGHKDDEGYLSTLRHAEQDSRGSFSALSMLSRTTRTRIARHAGTSKVRNIRTWFQRLAPGTDRTKAATVLSKTRLNLPDRILK